MPRTLPLLTLVALLSCVHAAAAEKASVGYELVPLYDTLWRRALTGSKETFGEVADYGARSFEAAGAKGSFRHRDTGTRLEEHTSSSRVPVSNRPRPV